MCTNISWPSLLPCGHSFVELICKPEVFGSVIGALITGLVAIAVFVQGNRNNRKREKERKEEAWQDSLSFFLKLIDDLKIYCSNGIESYLDFSTRIKAAPTEEHYLVRKANSSINRILSIPPDTVLKAIQIKVSNKKEALEIYTLFYKRLDYLEIENQQAAKVLEWQQDQIVKVRQKVQEELNNLVEMTSERFLSVLGRPEGQEKDPLFEILDELSMEYFPKLKEDGTFEFHYTNFIIPLRDQMLEYVRSGGHYSQYAFKLLNRARSLILHKTDIRVKAEHLGRTFHGYSEELKRVLKDLEANTFRLKRAYLKEIF